MKKTEDKKLNMLVAGVVVLILLIIGISFGIEGFIKDAGSKNGLVVEVCTGNKVIAYLSGDMIKSLAPNGETMLPIQKVLHAAGLNNFTALTITGTGGKKITLIASEVNAYEFVCSSDDLHMNLEQDGEPVLTDITKIDVAHPNER